MQLCQMRFVFAGLQGLGDDVLEQVGGAKVVIAFDPLNHAGKRLGEHPKADANARGEGFAIGASIDYAVRCSFEGER